MGFLAVWKGEQTWIHPLHAIWICAIGIAVVLPQSRLTQTVRVRHVAEGMEVIASLAWVRDDCV